MTPAADWLAELLAPDRLTHVVDIGANPIDGDPPYKILLKNRLCRLTGFEPQPRALAALNARKSDLETYLPHAVGDGQQGVLKICHAPGMSSLFRPDPKTLQHFPGFSEWGRVVREETVSTKRLDDIDLPDIDYLKIDVQGAELAVFQNGRARLKNAVAIQAEVSLIPLYQAQPVFGDIDLELRAQGFVPHTFAGINKRMIAPMNAQGNPHAGLNQMIEADVVYVRNFIQAERMSPAQLTHLALIAHHCYKSVDLALNCIFHLANRKTVAADAPQRYLAGLQKARG